MADKGGIQLLPETRKSIELKVPGENRMIYIGLGILLLVLVLFGAAKMVTGNLQAQVDEQAVRFQELEKSRDKVAEQKILSLSKQSVSISTFLANHTFWTVALGKLEKALQQQVKILSLTADASAKKITLSASAPSYTVIARQMASLVADDGIIDVDISGAKSSSLGSYEFNIILQFNEAKFLRSVTNE